MDEALYESLRELRREIAVERSVAAFVILHDSTLRDLARARPSTIGQLRGIRGMGERKLADFGDRLLERIAQHEQSRPANAGKESGD